MIQASPNTLKNTSSINRTPETNTPGGGQQNQQAVNESMRKNSQLDLHIETDRKRHVEEPGKRAKERTPTPTADTGRAHSKGHSSSTKISIRSESKTNKTLNKQKGSSVDFHTEPEKGCFEFEITKPGEKSTGHRSKEKAKESSRGNRSTEPHR